MHWCVFSSYSHLNFSSSHFFNFIKSLSQQQATSITRNQICRILFRFRSLSSSLFFVLFRKKSLFSQEIPFLKKNWSSTWRSKTLSWKWNCEVPRFFMEKILKLDSGRGFFIYIFLASTFFYFKHILRVYELLLQYFELRNWIYFKFFFQYF